MPSEQPDLFALEDYGRILRERIPHEEGSGVWVSLSETWCTVGYYTGYGASSTRHTLGQGPDLEAALQAAEVARVGGG